MIGKAQSSIHESIQPALIDTEHPYTLVLKYSRIGEKMSRRDVIQYKLAFNPIQDEGPGRGN